jgi:hypothetical protein
MPINIYADNDSRDDVAWLCDGSYSLPDQIHELESWLNENSTTLPPASYVADIGFTIRPEAFGGGAVISPQMMRVMAEHDIALYLSEYPMDDTE